MGNKLRYLWESEVRPLPKIGPPSPDRGKKKKPSNNKSEPKPDIPLVSPSFVIPKDRKYQMAVIRLNSSDWIFSQSTAIASCAVRDGYVIPESSIKYINANHNAWPNEKMAKYYRSFIGAQHYYNHIQDPHLSYGFVLDAKLRDVNDVHYVDLMVATSIRDTPNERVLQRVVKDELKTMSMGCMSPSVVCSRCGHVSDGDHDCEHLRYQLGNKFLLEDGTTSQVAAIVNDKNMDDKEEPIEFFEISWVDDNAFKGAVAGYRIDGMPRDREIYATIPYTALTRENPMHNGVSCWMRKGYVDLVETK